MGIINPIDLMNLRKESADFTGTVIGVPRALHVYEYFPFVREIVKGIMPGCELRLSPESTSTIKDASEKACPTEPCFSDKLAFGHVKTLLDDASVQYVLIPAVIRGEALPGSFPWTFTCPYAQTFPQMAIAAFPDHAERIIPLMIQAPRDRQPEMLDNIIKTAGMLGRKLTRKYARTILENARTAQARIRQELIQMGRETAQRAEKSGKPLFVLLGRSYNLSDKALNASVPDILADRGYESVTIDMLDLDEYLTDSEFVAANRHTYWLYHQRLLAAARYIRENPERLRAIYISNFGCGPDSFIIPQVQKITGVAKLLVITVDSQDARANIVTRVEAFLNTMDAAVTQKQPAEVHFGRIRNFNPLEKSKKRIVMLPNMCSQAQALSAVFRAYGTPSYTIRETTRQTMEVGRTHTTGQECYPFITTTGDLMHAALSGRVYVDRPEMLLRTSPSAKKHFRMDAQGDWYVPFSPETVAFFQGVANGPCRYGQYLPYQHQLINELLGFTQNDDKGLFFVSFNSEENYNPKGLGFLNRVRFKVRTWKSIRFLDFMEKALSMIRPREKTPGDTQAAFEASLEEVVKNVERNKSINPLIPGIVERFRRVPRHNDPMPIVLILGEVYVRLNRFANQDIARILEKNGIIALISPIGTWIKYIQAEYYRWKRRYGTFRDQLSALAEWKTLEYLERSMYNAFGDLFKGVPEPTVRELYEIGRRYIDESYSGEAIISMAEMEHAAHLGYNGALNVMPFTCMPSNIVRGVTPVLERKYPNFPIAHLEFDGADSPVHRELVEGFLYQVHHHFEMTQSQQHATQPS